MKMKPNPALPAPCDNATLEQALDHNQVAMVVMLVPLPSSSAGMPQPPAYVDSNDHVWLLVDKASPMAAVFQQIAAAEPTAGSSTGAIHSSPEAGAAVLSTHNDAAHADLASPAAESLSRRELDVLRLIADGRSNKEIAHSLILTLSTIKMHVKHIYGKLGVRNRVQAVAHARELGLLAM
jgi:DNA-binding CsgD family transcriptional regulator